MPDREMQGIRLVLEEIRDLRLESRKEREEDRRQREEEREEDRRRWEEVLHRMDAKFDRYVAESAERENGLRKALAIIGKYARDVFHAQREHTRLLRQIARGIRAIGNGRNGRNGRSR